MNIPKFNDREKALEDDYIRRKEYMPTLTSLQAWTSDHSFNGNNAANDFQSREVQASSTCSARQHAGFRHRKGCKSFQIRARATLTGIGSAEEVVGGA
jgi:hypothetical protein